MNSRIKLQESRSRSQESREDLIKISMKRIFQKLSSTWNFHKTCLPKSFYSLVIDYQIAVIDYQQQNCFEKVFKLNLQRSN